MTRQQQSQIRRYLIEERKVEKVRINVNGEVHALGTMPNSIVRGWYLVGYDTNIWEDIQDETRRYAR